MVSITWNVGDNANRFVVIGTLTNEVVCDTDALEGVIAIIVSREVSELYTAVWWRVLLDEITSITTESIFSGFKLLVIETLLGDIFVDGSNIFGLSNETWT